MTPRRYVIYICPILAEQLEGCTIKKITCNDSSALIEFTDKTFMELQSTEIHTAAIRQSTNNILSELERLK